MDAEGPLVVEITVTPSAAIHRIRTSVFVVLHGTWWGRYDAPRGADGKRRQVKLGPYATKKDAEAALAEQVRDVRHGTHVAAERGLTVARYLEDWLAGKVRLDDSTRHSYRQHLDLYLLPGLGHLRLVDLRDTDVEALYDAMRLIGHPAPVRPSQTLLRLLEARTDTASARRPLSDGTLRRVHSTLMSALNTAVKRRKVAANPALHVELATGRAEKALLWTEHRVEAWQRTGARPSPVMVWTPEQAGGFLDYAATDDLYALWHLVLFRGLRRGEAVGLPWSDVDLDAGSVRIGATLLQVGHRVIAGGTKSATSARTISLDAGTLGVLRAHRARQVSMRDELGAAYIDTGLVFTKPDGAPLQPDSVSQRWDRLVTRSGLPPVRFHDTRHVAASLTYRATRDLKLTSQMLGHASTAVTEAIYVSVFADVEREAADAAAALVPRAQRPVPTLCPPETMDPAERAAFAGIVAGQEGWGRWGLNPRPTDYESAALTG